MADIPAEAVTAAAALLTEAMTVTGTQPSPGELAANAGLALLMVEAAAPAIRAAERERIARGLEAVGVSRAEDHQDGFTRPQRAAVLHALNSAARMIRADLIGGQP